MGLAGSTSSAPNERYVRCIYHVVVSLHALTYYLDDMPPCTGGPRAGESPGDHVVTALLLQLRRTLIRCSTLWSKLVQLLVASVLGHLRFRDQTTVTHNLQP